MPPEAASSTNFTAIDWVIEAVYLAGTVAIGLYVRRFITNMADYVVAGRALRSCLAIATMIGSELGLVTVMYAAQKGFTGGFAAFHIGLVAGVVTLLVGMTGFIVVPLRQMGVMTIPEFYERRFGRGVRVMGGLILVLAGVLNMGLFLKAGTVFVTGLTGMTSVIELKIVSVYDAPGNKVTILDPKGKVVRTVEFKLMELPREMNVYRRLSFEIPKETSAGKIVEVTIGATSEDGGTRSHTVTIGGGTSLPFHFFEGQHPNRPLVAMEVFDRVPARYPDSLRECYGDLLGHPAEMARRCVDGHGAELISVRLEGTHPEKGDRSAEEAADILGEGGHRHLRGCGRARGLPPLRPDPRR